MKNGSLQSSDASQCWYIGNSSFPVIGMSDFEPRFSSIVLNDFGKNSFAPKDLTRPDLSNFVAISNALLQSKKTSELFKLYNSNICVFLMYDEKTFDLCQKMNLKVANNPPFLFQYFQSKKNAVELANELNIPTVPYKSYSKGERPTYKDLVSLFGHNLFVQNYFGHSGEGTFKITNEDEWNFFIQGRSHKLSDYKFSPLLKGLPLAIEACLTSEGVIVGPILSELIGEPNLTPYSYGWCGNQLFSSHQDLMELNQLRSHVSKFGEAMKRFGYKGHFTIDFLMDLNSGITYLSEVNPRISGASSLSNALLHSIDVPPLLSFHLDAFLGRSNSLNVNETNKKIAESYYPTPWSQIILKNTDPAGYFHFETDGVKVENKNDLSVFESDKCLFFPEASSGDWLPTGTEISGLLCPRPLYDEYLQTLTPEGSEVIREFKLKFHLSRETE